MEPATRTKLRKAAVLISVGLVLAFVDVWLWISPPEGDTFSEQTLSFAGEHPIGVLVVGIILGHLFWPQRTTTPPK